MIKKIPTITVPNIFEFSSSYFRFVSDYLTQVKNKGIIVDLVGKDEYDLLIENSLSSIIRSKITNFEERIFGIVYNKGRIDFYPHIISFSDSFVEGSEEKKVFKKLKELLKGLSKSENLSDSIFLDELSE
ncbi:MAG: hypothetical protein GON13_01195 [Nanoarchaeota archaeon]|nr:hypothetical protein [Nanoarchaeota archaeon]